MGTPAAGKTKWRNPSVTERRRSGIDANAPVLTHSHAHRTPGTASRGLLRGVPTGAGRDPPGEGPGMSPCPPTELFVCLILSRISLPRARRPPRTFPAFLRACARLPLTRTLPARPKSSFPPQLRGSEAQPCATLHTKPALAHAHSPCNTHRRGPAFSDVPRLRGSRTIPQPHLFIPGDEVFLSLCRSEERALSGVVLGPGMGLGFRPRSLQHPFHTRGGKPGQKRLTLGRDGIIPPLPQGMGRLHRTSLTSSAA